MFVYSFSVYEESMRGGRKREGKKKQILTIVNKSEMLSVGE